MAAGPLRSLTILGAFALACSSEDAASPASGDAGESTGQAADASTSTSSASTSGTTQDDESSTAAVDTSSDAGEDGSSDDGSSDDTTTGEPAICGDGIVAGDEPCDDGNDATNDGCTPACESQRVTHISTAGWHTCAILDTGALRCWGEAPAHGHPEIWDYIGDNETPASVGDVQIGGTPVQVVGGSRHRCVLLEGGTVRCWGESPMGQLGYGNVDMVLSPAGAGDLELGGVVTQLSAGAQHTCALIDDGTVRCWGMGGDGQLGHGSTGAIGDDETPASVAVVDVGDDVMQIAVGSWHTCALIDGGDVRCWGSGQSGALGYGNTESIGDDETPSDAGNVLVGGMVIQLSANGAATCALLESGSVRCWGFVEGGALGYPGLGVIGDDELPAEVGDVDIGGKVAEISVGALQICAVLETRNARCWGYGLWGNLGHGTAAPIGDDETPASAGDVPLGGPVALLDAKGYGHVCAVLESGAVRCWGFGAVGQLGQPSIFPQNIGDMETPDAVGYVEVF